MKYIILSLLAVSFYCQLAAETKPQKNDSVFQIVVNYLNAQEAAGIYPLVNKDFQLPNNNTAHEEYLTHDGGTGGYMSSLIIYPKRELAVIVLSNSAAAVMSAGQISKDMMQGIVERKL